MGRIYLFDVVMEKTMRSGGFLPTASFVISFGESALRQNGVNIAASIFSVSSASDGSLKKYPLCLSGQFGVLGNTP